MAKHAHRVMLIEHKVWKCTLPNCSWFVYIGQQWVIEGKYVVCWKCNDTFIATKDALRDEMPICDECRHVIKPTTTDADVEDFIKHMTQPIEESEPISDHTPSCPAYFDSTEECICGYK